MIYYVKTASEWGRHGKETAGRAVGSASEITGDALGKILGKELKA